MLSLTFLVGQSRGFAFAQFDEVSDARRFLERYYPSFTLYRPQDPNQAVDFEPAKIRIAYSRERDAREKDPKSEDDWKCEVV